MISVPCTHEEYEPEHVYVFSAKCLVTREPYTVRVPARALFLYNQGENIQTAMHMLSPEDREFLMSGLSPEGWNKTFGYE